MSDNTGTVSLREVTAQTVVRICELSVHPDQAKFVWPPAISIAQAYFEPRAWFRAIYADEEPVGFVLLRMDPEKPEYFLWRFMIAGEHQGKGYGWKALRLLADHMRSLPGATELLVSYVDEEGGPAPFYRKLGFVETGELRDGLKVARLAL